MQNNIKDAIELLRKNNYIIIKATEQMIKDSNECAEMMENGKDKDCSGCSCSICVVE